MAKIIALCGKSASGKNYIYNALLEKYPVLVPVVQHTTRPKRTGEINKKDYHFVNSKEFLHKVGHGDIFETREYITEHGLWYYGTSTSEIDINSNNIYITIVDYKSIKSYINQFGANNILSYYIQADTGVRLIRALEREVNIDDIKKQELIRRFKADEIAFKNIENWTRCTVFNNTKEDFEMTMEVIGYMINQFEGKYGI